MRAVVHQGNQQFAIKDLGDPAFAHGQVVVDVEFCAVCGTDVHEVMYDIARVGSVLATFNAPPQVRIPTTGSASLACHTPQPCVQSPYHRQSHR